MIAPDGSQIAVGFLRGVGTALARCILPTTQRVAEGVVSQADSAVGPHLIVDEAGDILQRYAADHYVELRRLLAYRDGAQSRPIALLGGAFLHLPAPVDVTAGIAVVVSGAQVREEMWEDVLRTTACGLSALEQEPGGQDHHPGILCALLLNAATAESHIPNRDRTLQLLKRVREINPRHLALLYNTVCIGARFGDERLMRQATSELLEAYPSAANPSSQIGRSIMTDKALAPLRASEAYRQLLPRLARVTKGGFRAWLNSPSGQLVVRLALLALLVGAMLALTKEARADMSLGTLFWVGTSDRRTR